MADYLAKLMKSDRVFTANQIKDKRKNSLVPTGSVGVDWATGGGIARNEMTLLWGPQQSGKSSLMLKMLGKEQKAFPDKKAIIFDSEYAFDPDRAESLGVDISEDRLIIVQGNGFDDCVTPLLKIEKDIIIEKDICFIGVDSVKGFVSASLENLFDSGKAEGTATLYGGIAKTLNPLLDILMRLANEAEIMVVLTNHAAMNLDANMAKYYPYVLSGGMKLRHLVGSIIFLEKSASKSSQVTGENGVSFGGTFRVKVGKSRRVVEGKQAEIRWNLINGEFIDQELELANLAKDLLIFQGDSADKKSTKLSFKVGETVIEAKNLPDMASILKQRPALYKKLVEACNSIAHNPTLGVAITDFTDDLDAIEEVKSKKKKG
jgi:RecA/RadA recombinase